jgi:hypothetical protein
VPGWVERLATPEDFGAGDRQELLVFNLLLRTLPFAKRTSLLREARMVVEKVPAMSAATKRESLRFHRAALVRQAWAMPALW